MLINALMEANKLAICLIYGQFSTLYTALNCRFFIGLLQNLGNFPLEKGGMPEAL